MFATSFGRVSQPRWCSGGLRLAGAAGRRYPGLRLSRLVGAEEFEFATETKRRGSDSLWAGELGGCDATVASAVAVEVIGRDLL